MIRDLLAFLMGSLFGLGFLFIVPFILIGSRLASLFASTQKSTQKLLLFSVPAMVTWGMWQKTTNSLFAVMVVAVWLGYFFAAEAMIAIQNHEMWFDADEAPLICFLFWLIVFFGIGAGVYGFTTAHADWRIVAVNASGIGFVTALVFVFTGIVGALAQTLLKVDHASLKGQ